MHSLRVPEAARESVQAALSRRAEVEWVEPNALLEPVAVPDDPRFEDAWHLGALGAPSAWDLSTGAGVTLAILDSGVDPNHPDLEGKLVPGYNFYDGNSDTRDVFGHGTRVAGVAAADTNNGIGVASIGWGAQLMPIRVTSTSGYASAWAIAQGLASPREEAAAARGVVRLPGQDLVLVLGVHRQQAQVDLGVGEGVPGADRQACIRSCSVTCPRYRPQRS